MGYIADIDSGMVELQKWLDTELQLPRIDPLLLRRFLYSCSGNVDDAKRLIEFNYNFRNKNPQIFLKRDPCDEGSRRLLEIADLVPIPGLTPNNSKLLFYRLVDFDADKFQFTEGVKVFFMLADCRFVTEDPAGLADGEIPIFDMAGFSLRHLTKVVFNSLRVYMKFVQEAHPVRLQEVHVLNCPSYLDKVLMVVKPFIKSEVFKLIKFHLPGSTTLYEYIPKEMLPEEYGGNAGPIADLKAKWMDIMKERRDYLMDESNWKVDTKKSKASCASPSSCSQSLRTLNID